MPMETTMTTRDMLLRHLKESGEAWISCEQISAELNVSRAAISKQIKKLRDQGYSIESASKKGYRLELDPDLLLPAEIRENLKNRVLSYFRSPSELGYKTATMMARAKKVEHFITGTETEALILERNLIKKYMPRYNVILRDDKQYPCLRLDVKEDFPRLSIVRKMKKDGARYFGPYASAGSVRSTVKLIDQVFLLRKCRSIRIPNRSRPCLNFQLGRCLVFKIKIKQIVKSLSEGWPGFDLV